MQLTAATIDDVKYEIFSDHIFQFRFYVIFRISKTSNHKHQLSGSKYLSQHQHIIRHQNIQKDILQALLYLSTKDKCLLYILTKDK